MSPAPIRIGTRGSALALFQAEQVRTLIGALPGAPQVEIIVLETTGDRRREWSLQDTVNIGIFTRELQLALLERRIDLAVHSLKDLPTSEPGGLALTAFLEREDARDVLVAPPGTTLVSLPAGSRIGTSSARRAAFIRHLCPSLCTAEIRGNVPTRLEKFARGDFDAIILAGAGLRRLGLVTHISEWLPATWFVPSPGQGAIAVETRADDTAITSWVAQIDHALTRTTVTAERTFLGGLDGGCRAPIGATAWLEGTVLRLHGAVLARDGRVALIDTHTGDPASPAELGNGLALQLAARGAASLLADARAAPDSV